MSTPPRCLLVASAGGTRAGGAIFGILRMLPPMDLFYTASGSTPVVLSEAAGAKGIIRTLAPSEISRTLSTITNPLGSSFLRIAPFAEHVVGNLPPDIRSTKDLPRLKITAALVNATFFEGLDGKPAYYVVLDSDTDMPLVKALAATCACPPVQSIPIENQTLTLIVDDGNGNKEYKKVHVREGLLLDPGMIEKIPITPALLDAKEGDVIFVMNLGNIRVNDKRIINLCEGIVKNEYFEKLARVFPPFAYLKFILLDLINSHHFDLEVFKQQALDRNIAFIEVSINNRKKTKQLNLQTLVTAITALASALKTLQELNKRKDEKGTIGKILNPGVIIPAVTALTAGYKVIKEVMSVLDDTSFDRRSVFDHNAIMPALNAGIAAASRALEDFQNILETRELSGDET
ncbi:hypothetical protein HY570_02365 [Candidatus Micrarchaeota archaeon]|nr:hypothetical protein [Candidatus Micrarchaeota archaeon]